MKMCNFSLKYLTIVSLIVSLTISNIFATRLPKLGIGGRPQVETLETLREYCTQLETRYQQREQLYNLLDEQYKHLTFINKEVQNRNKLLHKKHERLQRKYAELKLKEKKVKPDTRKQKLNLLYLEMLLVSIELKTYIFALEQQPCPIEFKANLNPQKHLESCSATFSFYHQLFSSRFDLISIDLGKIYEIHLDNLEKFSKLLTYMKYEENFRILCSATLSIYKKLKMFDKFLLEEVSLKIDGLLFAERIRKCNQVWQEIRQMKKFPNLALKINKVSHASKLPYLFMPYYSKSQ